MWVATGPCEPEGRSRMSTSYSTPSAVGAVSAVISSLVSRVNHTDGDNGRMRSPAATCSGVGTESQACGGKS